MLGQTTRWLRGAPMPSRFMSSADINATVARVTPAVLELLADGVPRRMKGIAEALADRHPKDEVEHTLMRLAVTGEITDRGKGYTLPSAALG